jgi:hypothetical protein
VTSANASRTPLAAVMPAFRSWLILKLIVPTVNASFGQNLYITG